MADYYIEEMSPLLRRRQATLFYGGPYADPHMHPAIELLYFGRGTYNVGIGRERFEAHEGDLALFRGNTVHSVVPISEDVAGYYVFTIHPSLVFSVFSDVSTAYAMLFLTPRFAKTGLIRVLSHETKSILDSSLVFSCRDDEECPPIFSSRLRIKASDLLFSLAENELRNEIPNSRELPDESLLRQIYDSILYINKNFEHQLTPLECAEKLHMSYSCYAKRFSQITGQSFKQYLFDVRMANAENLIVTSDASITEIALSCGYQSVSHFISEFRKYKGLSPLAFRKASINGE